MGVSEEWTGMARHGGESQYAHINPMVHHRNSLLRQRIALHSPENLIHSGRRAQVRSDFAVLAHLVGEFGPGFRVFETMAQRLGHVGSKVGGALEVLEVRGRGGEAGGERVRFERGDDLGEDADGRVYRRDRAKR